jgi:hypothetical protein
MKIKYIILFCILPFYVFASETNVVENVSEYGWELLRDPFWPVGYVPPKVKKNPNTAAVGKAAQVVWPKLDITGISKFAGGSYIAFIKSHGMVEVGDSVTVTKDGFVFEFEITSVTKTGIQYKKRRFSLVNEK